MAVLEARIDSVPLVSSRSLDGTTCEGNSVEIIPNTFLAPVGNFERSRACELGACELQNLLVQKTNNKQRSNNDINKWNIYLF